MRCFVLSEELWSTWVFDVCVEREAMENMIVYICVEREYLEQMSYENAFVEHEALKHMKEKIGSVGHKPWSLPNWGWA